MFEKNHKQIKNCLFVRNKNHVRDDNLFFECFDVRKIIEYDFKIRVFEGVKFFYKTYKLVVVDKSKNNYKIKHYL